MRRFKHGLALVLVMLVCSGVFVDHAYAATVNMSASIRCNRGVAHGSAVMHWTGMAADTIGQTEGIIQKWDGARWVGTGSRGSAVAIGSDGLVEGHASSGLRNQLHRMTGRFELRGIASRFLISNIVNCR